MELMFEVLWWAALGAGIVRMIVTSSHSDPSVERIEGLVAELGKEYADVIRNK